MSKYQDLAKEAILALRDRNGSSLPALKKQLNLTADKFRFLNAALTKGVESGAFIKVKGTRSAALFSSNVRHCSPDPSYVPVSGCVR
jgi:hypothetical protein